VLMRGEYNKDILVSMPVTWVSLDLIFSYHYTSNISELFPNGTATPATEAEVGETVFPTFVCFLSQ
jgi:hypothetical protein